MFILATISKNSYTEDKIEEIIRAGATVLRFNFSHGTPDQMYYKISRAKAVINKLKLKKQVKILADLPGNKLRMGSFPNNEYAIEVDKHVTFKSGKRSEDPTKFIPVVHERVGTLVEVGQFISIGDGELGFEIIEIIDQHTIRAKATKTRLIPGLKGFNIGQKIDQLDHITPKTIEHMQNLSVLEPEWVSFSFVNSAAMLKKGKKLLKKNTRKSKWKPKIVAKLESPLAIKNLEEITKEADINVVARGDLGLYCPIEELGLLQKKIIKVSKKYKKPVIVATQILDSLLEYHIPSRAEVLDLTNIFLDGADGIWLAKETGISLTPGYSVEVAKKIIKTLESSKEQVQLKK